MKNIFEMVNDRLNILLSSNEKVFSKLDYFENSCTIKVYKNVKNVTKMIYFIDLLGLYKATKMLNPNNLALICYFVIMKSIGGEINGN